MINYCKMTSDNLDEAKDSCASIDQRRELEIGDETWGIMYGNQRGQMSRYNDCGRGAVSFGGDSLWGDWSTHEDIEVLYLADGTLVDEHGNQMTTEEMYETLDTIIAERAKSN